MKNDVQVWIVDDEVSVIKVTASLLESVPEFCVKSFLTAEELLAELKPGFLSCIISDLVMPGMNGIDLQTRLREIDPALSVVILSGKADIASEVKLMQGGAVTVLEKPYDPDHFISVVRDAANKTCQARAQLEEMKVIKSKIDKLSEEEIDVMWCLVKGLGNKEVAFQLNMSPRTVDRRRQSLFQTMQVESIAELASQVERFRVRMLDQGHDVKSGPHRIPSAIRQDVDQS